jgi:uncharacterized protein YecE (DUF72 family)
LRWIEVTEVFIGAGGWAYFQVPGLRPLEAYARAFNFVEVNSTFYTRPRLQRVQAWRQRVPPDFEFSVRCHRDVTHRFQLEPIPEVLDAVTRMQDICRVLRSKYLVLQTPASFPVTASKVDACRQLFRSLSLKGLRLVWEVRQKGRSRLPLRLRSLMQDLNVIHCVDLSRETPATDADVLYTRVFGKGEHNRYQFTDEELVDIDRTIVATARETAVVSFHNVRMYKDAARYQLFRQRSQFSPVTRGIGQQALKEVLREDTVFPVTKAELLTTQGWKVIDVQRNQRVHADTLLHRLPDRYFTSVEEVLTALPKE